MKIKTGERVFASKTAFVLAQPSEMSAKGVVELGAKHGAKLSVGQVYNIRSVSKKTGKKRRKVGMGARLGNAGEPLAKVGDVVSAPSRKRGRPKRVETGSAVASMRRAIAELGLARAREVLSEVAQAFA